MGLFRGCLDSQAPFIIQISKGARKYTDKRMLEAIIRTADEVSPKLFSRFTSITVIWKPAWTASRVVSTAR